MIDITSQVEFYAVDSNKLYATQNRAPRLLGYSFCNHSLFRTVTVLSSVLDGIGEFSCLLFLHGAVSILTLATEPPNHKVAICISEVFLVALTQQAPSMEKLLMGLQAGRSTGKKTLAVRAWIRACIAKVSVFLSLSKNIHYHKNISSYLIISYHVIIKSANTHCILTPCKGQHCPSNTSMSLNIFDLLDAFTSDLYVCIPLGSIFNPWKLALSPTILYNWLPGVFRNS